MFIKYENNIHNLNNYFSVVKKGTKLIHLTKEAGNYYALEFVDTFSRDKVLNNIWEELQKNSKFFDIDDVVLMYNEVKRYNVV